MYVCMYVCVCVCVVVFVCVVVVVVLLLVSLSLGMKLSRFLPLIFPHLSLTTLSNNMLQFLLSCAVVLHSSPTLLTQSSHRNFGLIYSAVLNETLLPG